MPTSRLTIPGEPLPSTSSTNRNFYRLSQPTPSVLLLVPNREWLWCLIGCLVCFPIVVAVCIVKQVWTDLAIMLSGMPLFGVAIFGAMGFFYHKFGTRARFDLAERQISVTGLRHRAGLNFRLADVRAVQLCDVGVQGDRSWHAFQVNLVVQTTEQARITLLDSGGEAQLHSIAQRIAEFLRVPFYVGSQVA